MVSPFVVKRYEMRQHTLKIVSHFITFYKVIVAGYLMSLYHKYSAFLHIFMVNCTYTGDKMRYLRVIFCFILVSCSLLMGCGNSQEAPTPTAPSQDFSHWCDEVFREEISQNTLNLHYTLENPGEYGITAPVISLGSYKPKEQTAYLKRIRQYAEILNTYDYDSLKLEEQLTYDILKYHFHQTLSNRSFYYYGEPLGSVTGIQAQLPILLSEYEFYRISDIPVYLNLLAQVESYYTSIINFEKQKARNGLFMSEQAADAIISQCEDFLKNPSQNMLILTFNERIDAMKDLDSRLAMDYKTQNMQTFISHVIPAYKDLISALKELKAYSNNQDGLCYLKGGASYYEALVAETTGSDRSIPELKSLINKYYKTDLLSLKACLENGEIAAETLSSFQNNNPEEILLHLSHEIAADFPQLADVNYQVKYVNENLAEHISPAFYLTPPIDNSSQNVIYINPASDLKELSLFTTLAHEGYPGHLYQTVYSSQKALPNIRSLLSFGGYTEGWATYAEMYSYRLYGLDDISAAYYMHTNTLNLSLYARLDIGIHYDGWKLDEIKSFLSQFGITEEATARAIQTAILEAPANYLKYYIGYLEFCELKEKALEFSSGDDSQDLKNFHTVILSLGPAPFSIIEKYMDNYYDILNSSK